MDEKQVVLILITVGYAWVIDWQPWCICYLAAPKVQWGVV
jgi:hypothetical protein